VDNSAPQGIEDQELYCPGSSTVPAVSDTEIAAIDFETATASRASACSVGIAISEGDTVQVKEWLIQPPDNEYDGFNTWIHGLGPQDTADAPNIVEVWDEVSELIGDRMLVAHNAAFDVSVLRSSFGNLQTALPREYDYACSYRTAKRVWPERWSYRLGDIAKDLEFENFHHHNAGSDAHAVLQIVEAILNGTGESSFRKFILDGGFLVGRVHLNPESWDSFSHESAGDWKASDITGDPTKFQPDHPFYHQRLVITGTLPNGMSRHEAYQRIVDLGGDVASGMSKKVNILVVADLDPFVIGDDGMSSKLRKARDLAEAGHPVELMDSREFAKLLGA